MAFTYTLHPNNTLSLPDEEKKAYGSDSYARYFCFYTANYVTSLTSISVSHTITASGSGGYGVYACWTDSNNPNDEGPYHYGVRNHSSSAINILNGQNMSTLKTNFNKARQYLVIRVGFWAPVTIQVKSFTITANGT